MALDILHAKPYRPSLYWKIIQESREMFYTSEMSAFMGYCMHQAAKYSIKGSRLHSAKMFRDCLTEEILGDCKIPYDDHIKQVSMLSYPEQPAVEVVGKMFSLKTKTEYIKPVIEKFINEYGKRSQLAEQNQGVDYKAISHINPLFRQGAYLTLLRPSSAVCTGVGILTHLPSASPFGLSLGPGSP